MVCSVVTPSFNQLDWLELCIASVADQRDVGFVEHLVCDGQSEGIEDFKKRMLERFPESSNYCLKFIVDRDQGMYDAINKGLRRARGEICSYLNCDEQLLPGSLATVGGYFASHKDADMLFGDTIVVDREGRPLCYWRPYVPSLAHLAGATLNTLSCSTFFRRTVVEAGHLFEPQWKAVGDLHWIRGLLEKDCSMACEPRPLAAFTFLGDNLGAGAKAREEFEASRESAGGWRRFFRRSLHAFRKLLSGAFVRRKVTYDLFTLSDPARRRRFSSESLGWTWPVLAESR